ncbi:MAG: AAA family ATPase [Spirochaetia bacterium]|jgi:MoxR-like ATPase|nr:AAA family ATPase [Spirochaetia bacterium]
MELHQRIHTLISYLDEGLVERKEAVTLSLLCAIAGESLFFYGPPGTAKSMISRRLSTIFTDHTAYFEYLMNQFSTPEDLFGPISLKGLERDEYKRLTDGYLPTATVAFLDEIWKAGPAIQNTLLSIINEKKYNNGNQVEQVPLLFIVAASNELPAEGKGLEALWDRFLVRLQVKPIEDETGFFALVTQTGDQMIPDTCIITQARLSVEELEAWHKEADSIILPQPVRNTITAIRKQLIIQSEKDSEAADYYVSDRRWKKIIHLLRTSAFLNGRKEVDLLDCFLIQYCIWSTRKQLEQSFSLVASCIKETLLGTRQFAEELETYQTKVKKTCMGDTRKDPILVRIGNEDCYRIIGNTTDHRLLKKASFLSSTGTYDHKKRKLSSVTYGIRTYMDVKQLRYDDIGGNVKAVFSDGTTAMFTVATKEKLHQDAKKRSLFADKAELQQLTERLDTSFYRPLQAALNEAQQQCRKLKLEPNFFTSKESYAYLTSAIEAEDKKLEGCKLQLEQIRSGYAS